MEQLPKSLQSKARQMLVWFGEYDSFMDLFLSFNLVGFGLMFALLGLILARSHAPLSPDVKATAAQGLASVGGLLAIAGFRLLKARRQVLAARG